MGGAMNAPHNHDAQATEKARILGEALPYIQRFHGKTIIVKFGGNAMTDDVLKSNFARDVVLLKLVGMNPVVVHGGGPQIETALARLGMKGTFVTWSRWCSAAR
jgi:acetylglutamate kinase